MRNKIKSDFLAGSPSLASSAETTEAKSLSAQHDALDLAYQDWLRHFNEIHQARFVLLQAWPRKTDFWGNVLRGVASTATLFPNTLLSCARLRFFGAPSRTETREASEDDCYNVGHDLYTVLRRDFEEAALKSATDDRPHFGESRWTVPNR
jgi:hypothetical protein